MNLREWLTSLVALSPAPHDRWPIGLQAGLAVFLPLAVFTVLGRQDLGLQAAAGAFTAIYLAGATVRERARALPLVAVGLIASVAAGALLAPTPVAVLVGLVVVAAVSGALVYGFHVGPPGPVFFVLVYGLAAHVVGAGSTPAAGFIGMFALGCLIAVLIVAAPLVVPRVRREPARPLRVLLPGPSWDPDARVLLLRVVVVALAATVIGSLWADPTRTYWAVCSGIAVIGVNVGRWASLIRGSQRLVGTMLGVALFAAVAWIEIPPLVLPFLLGGLQFVVELLVVRNYALALTFITPLVLILTIAAVPGADAGDLIATRAVDTVIGAVLGAASGLLHTRARA